MASVAFVANPAQSATFTVNGTVYDITTTYGSYKTLSSQLQANPWWGNQGLAAQLSSVVKDQLGLPNTGNSSPYFAYGTFAWNGDPVGVLVLNYFSETQPALPSQQGLDPWNGASTAYAVGTAVPAAVPEPLTILGSITAAGFGVAFKRKKNSNKEE